jgi:hypothetical protein
MGEYQETCPYCGNKYNVINGIQHSLCKDYYEFLLDEKIEKMRQQLELCLEIQKKHKDLKK